MVNPAIPVGVVLGSFLAVACFGFTLHKMRRGQQRELFLQGLAFAVIRTEHSRFSGEQKRVKVARMRPTPEQMQELQEYYGSKECGTGWESEVIECTFKTMQLLGQEVALFRKGQLVDLSRWPVRLGREAKKEMQKLQKKQKRADDSLEEAKRPEEDDFTAIRPS